MALHAWMIFLAPSGDTFSFKMDTKILSCPHLANEKVVLAWSSGDATCVKTFFNQNFISETKKARDLRFVTKNTKFEGLMQTMLSPCLF